jgi:hypothetical protein
MRPARRSCICPLDILTPRRPDLNVALRYAVASPIVPQSQDPRVRRQKDLCLYSGFAPLPV